MIDLRPLTLGELVDRSAALWRAHWKSLFKLYLGFQLGQFLVLKSWEVISRLYFPLGRGGPRMIEAMQSEPEQALRDLGGSLIGLAGVVGIYVLVGYFTGIAGTAFIWPRMLSRTATVSESLRRAVARLGTTLRFFFLMIGWSLIVG